MNFDKMTDEEVMAFFMNMAVVMMQQNEGRYEICEPLKSRVCAIALNKMRQVKVNATELQPT